MLLNPRKKRRTAAQKAATRRLVSFNRGRGRARKRRRNPSPARARRRPARRRSRARGILGGATGVMDALMPAAIGGAGALGVDVLFGFLPIPPQFKTGIFAPIAKIAGAVAVGWVAGQFATKRTADQIMVGAITVTVYNLAKGWMQTAMPQIALGEYVNGYGSDTMGYVSAAQFQPDPLLNHIPDFETRQSAGLAEYVGVSESFNDNNMGNNNNNGW